MESSSQLKFGRLGGWVKNFEQAKALHFDQSHGRLFTVTSTKPLSSLPDLILHYFMR
jgi:hypothetical protein